MDLAHQMNHLQGFLDFSHIEDPNCKNTFNHFKKSIEWLDTNLSQQNLMRPS